MKSPKDMRIIQIDVTNACIHQCSNCTRFCGHHKKPFFMDLETFKRAVDSLDGYEGTIGIMGGEPTLHPDFDELVRYLASKYPPKYDNKFIVPQTNFLEAIRDLELSNTYKFEHNGIVEGSIKGPGLWSAAGKNYKDHYEVIQDSIAYQVLNDHTGAIFHQPALITRKELGIPDEKWVKLRDNCWVQNYWSATITPKGAFFCEVAGALDMLLDGPGGWEIEPGWWKRSPEEFEEQLEWCEKCSLACEVFSRDASDEIDDMSESFYRKLLELGSPKVKAGKINIIKTENGVICEDSKPKGKIYGGGTTYVESYFDKMNMNKNDLRYKKIIGVFKFAPDDDIRLLENNIEIVEEAYIATDCEGKKDILRLNNNKIAYIDDTSMIGKALYMALVDRKSSDTFILYTDRGIMIKNELIEYLADLILNPGTLHKCLLNRDDNSFFGACNGGYAFLFGSIAKSIKNIGYDRLLHISDSIEILEMWEKNKIVELCPGMERHAPKSKFEKLRYVIYGAGRTSNLAVKKVLEAGGTVVALVDKEKAGKKTALDYPIEPPDYLINSKDKYDRIIIASVYFYKSIKDDIEKMGIREDILNIM